jgi:glutamate racemase
MARAPHVLVFDSGVGGLSVLVAARAALAGARFSYVADDAAFPYGRLQGHALVDRVVAVLDREIAARAPDLAIIACNTASTLVLPVLRARHAIPFVGTVPAVKPATAMSVSRLVSVLATPATVARDYTHALVREFGGDCAVTLVGAARLAAEAEKQLRGEPVDHAVIAEEIAPCFVERDGRRTDVVSLACTHYPLLIDALAAASPWPVAFIDPGPAIARRAADLLSAAGMPSASVPSARSQGEGTALFTAGPPGPALAAALRQAGLGVIVDDPYPFAGAASPALVAAR